MASPDHRYRMQFDPQSATSAWWRLRAAPGGNETGWCAEFGELVPAEVLAGFTDALIAPPPQQPDPWQAVTSAGSHRDSGCTARSPDSMCHIELRPLSEFSGRSSWHVETCEPGDGQFSGLRLWHAYFGEAVPAHLVGSFPTVALLMSLGSGPTSVVPTVASGAECRAPTPASRASGAGSWRRCSSFTSQKLSQNPISWAKPHK